jgi:hypothetical protein
LLIKNYGGENSEINLVNESFLLQFFRSGKREAGSGELEAGSGEFGERKLEVGSLEKFMK